MLVLALSVVIGVVVGLLGAGGSIMTTPLFVYVEGMKPVEAIASSLLVVAAASSFALIRHGMRGHIQWRTGFIFGFSGMLSAFVGGQVGSHLPGDLLLFAFSVIMAVTGFAMIRRRKKTAIETAHKPRTYSLNSRWRTRRLYHRHRRCRWRLHGCARARSLRRASNQRCHCNITSCRHHEMPRSICRLCSQIQPRNFYLVQHQYLIRFPNHPAGNCGSLCRFRYWIYVLHSSKGRETQHRLWLVCHPCRSLYLL
jgi:hypothetical protein